MVLWMIAAMLFAMAAAADLVIIGAAQERAIVAAERAVKRGAR